MLGKKYDFRNAEKKHIKMWMDEGIYRFDPDSPREIYSIDTPPPTVSGNLHIGHIFSYTQAEMIARFHRMQDRNVFYPMGFDDNGLPTERLVEKEIGIPASRLPREEFIGRCMEIVEKYEAEYKISGSRWGSASTGTFPTRPSVPKSEGYPRDLFSSLPERAALTWRNHPCCGAPPVNIHLPGRAGFGRG